MSTRSMLTALTLAAAFGSTACLYESPVPIAPSASLPYDSSLVGLWRQVSPDNEDTAKVTILPFDRTYLLVHYTNTEDTDDWPDGRMHLYFRAHPSTIGSVRFMNLQVLGEDKPNYVLFRYVRDRDELRVRGVKDKVPEGLATSATLLTFLRANLENDSIYEPWVILSRVRDR